MTAQAARQGRFASSFTAARAASVGAASLGTARVGNASVRIARDHPRRAWQRGLRAAFVPWFGPVFWPYAYSDIFEYTFWPGGYDDGYWAYAYDDFFDGVFWGEQGPPRRNMSIAEPATAPAAAAPTRADYAAVQNLCTQPGNGITAWPFAEIEQKVGLNAEQKRCSMTCARRGGRRRRFKASCPAENAFPMTPPGRLQAMRARLKRRSRPCRPCGRRWRSSTSRSATSRRSASTRSARRAAGQRRSARRLGRTAQELQGAQDRPVQPADREDRGRGEADRGAAAQLERSSRPPPRRSRSCRRLARRIRR